MAGCWATDLSKQFWTFLAIGLAVVAIGVGVTWVGSKGSHVDLTGQILKMRVHEMNPNASLAVIDFRITNPADVNFMVKTVEVELTPASGDPVIGMPISKPDVENIFKYEKFLGSKYNDVLTIRDKIDPHQKMDRMVGVRFEMGEAAIEARKNLKLRIQDMDGAIAEITEKRATNKHE
jgi:hypothetical protein